MAEINIKTIYNPYIGSTPSIQQKSEIKNDPSDEASFSQILKKELNKDQLKFSKHAQQRVDSRQVEVTPQLMEKLNDAVSQAKEKGIDDALIISNKSLFIVNVASNTVITTLNNEESKNRIFTNINGTVII